MEEGEGLGLGTRLPRSHVKTEEGSGHQAYPDVFPYAGMLRTVIEIMTVYDVSAAQLFECWRRLAQYREQQRVYAVGRRRMV